MSAPTDGVVLIDGARVDAAHAVVSIYDRGFLYGDSVFEVIRTYGGAPFGLRDHVARLHASAGKLAIDPTWDQSALVTEIEGAVRDAGFSESYVRIVVTRGTGPLGLDPDLARTPTRVVLVHPLALPAAPVYRDGVAVLVADAPRATDGTRAQGAKASNYLANLLALKEAKARGAYEPLFVDRGASGASPEVLEGGTSNVFAIFDDVLVTPPLGRILSGITRRYVLEAAPQVGLRVEESTLTLARLCAADEAFLTSTIREVVPIVRVLDGATTHAIGAGAPFPRVRELHRAFRRHVGAPSSPMPWE